MVETLLELAVALTIAAVAAVAAVKALTHLGLWSEPLRVRDDVSGVQRDSSDCNAEYSAAAERLQEVTDRYAHAEAVQAATTQQAHQFAQQMLDAQAAGGRDPRHLAEQLLEVQAFAELGVAELDRCADEVDEASRALAAARARHSA